jgi:hypothetical protein
MTRMARGTRQDQISTLGGPLWGQNRYKNLIIVNRDAALVSPAARRFVATMLVVSIVFSVVRAGRESLRLARPRRYRQAGLGGGCGVRPLPGALPGTVPARIRYPVRAVVMTE